MLYHEENNQGLSCCFAVGIIVADVVVFILVFFYFVSEKEKKAIKRNQKQVFLIAKLP